jgi:protoporphyrinogen oxidase
MKNRKIIIIGAGPCGLGAGWRLKELGYDNFVVYEKESHAGGLASSYIDEKGFTWDVGGHVLHSHYPYFDRVFEKVMDGEYFTHQRESWVWIYDRFVPYPFQNNIHRLPKKILEECLAGLKKTTSAPTKKLTSFKDWIIASFGRGIAKHFLLPYNFKVWAYPPERMNWVWTGDRVAKIDLSRIEKNIRDNTDDVAWGPNAVFHFPKRGGTGDIWKRVAHHIEGNIVYDKCVIQIDSDKKKVFFSDGTTDTYDVLFTSMPLDVLTTSIKNKTFLKSPLHYSKVSIVGLGIKGEVPDILKTKCWMYFPEDKAPFFRATVFSNYSKYNAPKGTWSLMTETASSAYRPLPKEDIIGAVIKGAKNTKLISKSTTIVSTWLFQTDHGYPTPTIERDVYLAKILPMLEKLNIFSRGRFGAWKYEVSNQDHTFMQGVEWVHSMVSNKQELTIHNPNIVNNPQR